jgi:hypothetical protein
MILKHIARSFGGVLMVSANAVSQKHNWARNAVEGKLILKSSIKE